MRIQDLGSSWISIVSLSLYRKIIHKDQQCMKKRKKTGQNVSLWAKPLLIYSFIQQVFLECLPFIIKCSRDATVKKQTKTNETRTPLTLPLQNLHSVGKKTINKGINIQIQNMALVLSQAFLAKA